MNDLEKLTNDQLGIELQLAERKVRDLLTEMAKRRLNT